LWLRVLLLSPFDKESFVTETFVTETFVPETFETLLKALELCQEVRRGCERSCWEGLLVREWIRNWV